MQHLMSKILPEVRSKDDIAQTCLCLFVWRVTDAHIKWIGYTCAIFLSILHFSLGFLEFVFLSDPSLGIKYKSYM